MTRSLFAVATSAFLLSHSVAQAQSVNLSEDELMQICNSQDQKIQFGGKMFVMGVLEVAKSKVVPTNMRLCPKGGKKSSDYFDQACDWIAADQNRHTRSAMLAVIASAASEACPVGTDPEVQ